MSIVSRILSSRCPMERRREQRRNAAREDHESKSERPISTGAGEPSSGLGS
jgi:hypothetical protein